MNKRYKAAIIGCGLIAGGYDERSGFRHVFTHAGAYRKHPGFDLIAVAENNTARLSDFQRIWHVPKGYADYRKMLKNERVDLLSVCVPDRLHFNVIRDALKYGTAKCILVEKPIAETPDKSEELIRLCKTHRVSLYVNYNRLWDPIHRGVNRLIAEGSLGRIQSCVAYYVRGIKHNGTTVISTLKFLLGEEIAWVQALTAKRCEIKGDLALDGILALNNGLQVFLIASDKGGYGHSIFEIDIMGNKGRIRLVDNGYEAQLYGTREYKRYAGFSELAVIPLEESRRCLPKSKMDRTLLCALDDIAMSLDKRRVNLYYAEEAVNDMCVAGALISSQNRHGARIRI